MFAIYLLKQEKKTTKNQLHLTFLWNNTLKKTDLLEGREKGLCCFDFWWDFQDTLLV